MTLLLVESTAVGWYILLLIFLAFGVPTLLLIVGIAIRAKNKKASKIIFIITTIYIIIGLGVCGGVII